jgi:superfamily I DNA/RNA helicase
MYEKLSPKQKEILNYDCGKVVVKACPGSGKTYSVSARISRLLKKKEFKRKGIAAISFTNVACDEINEKLLKDFKVLIPLIFPHFLGTIDSFINKYIFLPFGHLIMRCDKRPELVGEPHSSWNVKKFERDYDQYFDKTSFDINGDLISISDSREFNFIWNYKNKDGSINGHIKKILMSKEKYFKRGVANQTDANYIAFKILKQYPLIANNIANQFKYIIVDEAQDTDDVQMKILEILTSMGLNNIMLIGDRDQAIFEWKNAKPELFDKKYEEWDKIDLNENRRSSQNICDFITYLSSFDKIKSINDNITDFKFEPEILGFSWPKKRPGSKNNMIVKFEDSKNSFEVILNHFLHTCKVNNISINKDNVAVLYRSKSNSKYLGLKQDTYKYKRSPWLVNKHYIKDIVRGKLLYENGNLYSGYKLLEKGYFEVINESPNKNFYFTAKHVQNEIGIFGFKNHRDKVFKFIDILPTTKNKLLKDWIVEANETLDTNSFKIQFHINQENGILSIGELFGSDLESNNTLSFYYGTIHSVQGKTYQAVLLLLGKSAGNKYYATILKSDYDTLIDSDKEELRIVYVGISRPSKILMMGVPNNDLDIWKRKFCI